MARLVRISVIASVAAMSVVRAASYDGFVRTPNINEHVDDVRVNIEDQRTLNWVSAFSITDPNGTIHNLRLNGELTLKATIRRQIGGSSESTTEVISSKSGKPTILAVAETHANLGQTAAINFSVCGDRVIMLYGGKNPGRCADLPPMAKQDPHASNCGGSCAGPYEGMPTVIASHDRIAPLSEPGEHLTITGRVVDLDGHPREGVIVYAYHTNRLGIYPPSVPPRSLASNGHGQFRGWARSDAEGRYFFETIRPGNYPNSHAPQHVHMHIIEPGCLTYPIRELQFSDDPIRGLLTEEERKFQEDAAVKTPKKTANGWEVTRDIRLGEGVKDYMPCFHTK